MKWHEIFSQKTGLIDWWSAAHLAWGLFFGALFILLKNKFIFLNKPKYFFLSGLILLISWEILEAIGRFYRKYLTADLMKPFVAHENLTNVVSDVVIGMIGLGIIYVIFFKQTT